jgi:hypothetical protein
MGGTIMPQDHAERRGARGRRWLSDRRLLSTRRIEEVAFDGTERRIGERRSGNSRRQGDRRAA